MARRVSRGRSFGRRRFRGGAKPAGAFAQATAGDGRSLNWESLVGELCYPQWSVFFPTDVQTVQLCGEQNFDIKRRAVIPTQVNAGAYTIERIRGFIEVVWLLEFADLTNIGGVVGSTMF